MKTKILTKFIILFLCFSNSNFAQTQQEMNLTAKKSYEKADKELNEVYSKLIKSLDNSKIVD